MLVRSLKFMRAMRTLSTRADKCTDARSGPYMHAKPTANLTDISLCYNINHAIDKFNFIELRVYDSLDEWRARQACKRALNAHSRAASGWRVVKFKVSLWSGWRIIYLSTARRPPLTPYVRVFTGQ